MSEPTEGHTVRRYDADLQQLRLDLLEMGALVLDQLNMAVHSLIDNRAGDARARPRTWSAPATMPSGARCRALRRRRPATPR